MLTMEEKKKYKRKTVIDRLNELESNDTQTVADLKKYLSKSFFVSGTDYPLDATVEVFSPVIPFYRRDVVIGGIHTDQLALDGYYMTEKNPGAYFFNHLVVREIDPRDFEEREDD